MPKQTKQRIRSGRIRKDLKLNVMIEGLASCVHEFYGVQFICSLEEGASNFLLPSYVRKISGLAKCPKERMTRLVLV